MAALTGDRDQISSASVKYEFINNRSSSSKKGKERLEALFEGNGELAYLEKCFQKLAENPLVALAEFKADDSYPATPIAMDDLRGRLAKYKTTLEEEVDDGGTEKGTILSAKLLYSRPLGEPRQSTLKIVYEKSPDESKWDLTANAGMTIFNSTEGLASGIGRLKRLVRVRAGRSSHRKTLRRAQAWSSVLLENSSVC